MIKFEKENKEKIFLLKNKFFFFVQSFIYNLSRNLFYQDDLNYLIEQYPDILLDRFV